MNIYQATINALSEDELKQAVRELQEFDSSDVLPVGVLLRMLNKLQEESEDDAATVLGVTRCALHERAAYKFAGI